MKCSCLWDGCTTSKVMLKDSLNRHVVTVHFGEGFHCQGCDQNFSRKDVYNKHVESGGVCRNAGAAIVYDIVLAAVQALKYLSTITLPMSNLKEIRKSMIEALQHSPLSPIGISQPLLLAFYFFEYKDAFVSVENEFERIFYTLMCVWLCM